MSNPLSPQLLAQMLGQESSDPFLFLVTLSHSSFSTIRLVNDVDDFISNGNTFTAFPMQIGLPKDDGDSQRELTIEFDNINRDLITSIRSVTTEIDVKIEMVLASLPNDIQFEFSELKIQSLSYTKSRVVARLFMDSFLNTEMTSEKYTPTLFPGLF
jgi:hypothetical protein